MRRIAWFRVDVDAESEEEATLWITVVAQSLNLVAEQAAEEFAGRIKLTNPMEYGQSFPLPEQEVRAREDV